MNIKSQIDNYIKNNYKQLDSTTTKIIKKRNRFLDASTVISHTYLYLLNNQQEISDFAILHGKTIDHIIYSFTLKYINSSIYWDNSDINKENDRLFNKVYKKPKDLEYEETEPFCIAIDEIYTEDFIESFYKSLDKLDRISFKCYYYDGIDNAKDFADHFDISVSSAYNSINKLKILLKDFIKINKIH